MDYQIVHAIEGRLRLRIPLLGTDAVFAGKLQQLVEAIAPVTSVRISALAQSIVITYKSKKISQSALIEAIEAAIAQIAPPPEEPDENEEPAEKPDSAVPLEKDVDSSQTKTSAEVPPANSPIFAEGQSAVLSADYPVNETVFDPSTIDLEADPWADPPLIPQPPAAASIPAANTVPLVSLDIIKTFLEDIPALSKPLSSKALAARLGVTVQTLNRYRSKPNFGEWCQSKDPDSIVWHFDATSKQFSPTIPEANNAISEAEISALDLLEAHEIDLHEGNGNQTNGNYGSKSKKQGGDRRLKNVRQ